jgi:hypothetical protein
MGLLEENAMWYKEMECLGAVSIALLVDSSKGVVELLFQETVKSSAVDCKDTS